MAIINIPGKSKPINTANPIDGTKNFMWGEALLAGSRRPKNWRITANIIELANVLQQYRDTVLEGRPIYISSWLRLGDGGSAHDFGKAVDFNVAGLSPAEVYRRLSNHNGGLGRYDGHVHLDTWHRRRWSGKSQ
jgi:hypothetical protein